jgi:hypothetical protein
MVKLLTGEISDILIENKCSVIPAIIVFLPVVLYSRKVSAGEILPDCFCMQFFKAGRANLSQN